MVQVVRIHSAVGESGVPTELRSKFRATRSVLAFVSLSIFVGLAGLALTLPKNQATQQNRNTVTQISNEAPQLLRRIIEPIRCRTTTAAITNPNNLDINSASFPFFDFLCSPFFPLLILSIIPPLLPHGHYSTVH